MEFRIIAIKPLKGCDENILKILKPNTTYFFYSGYNINKTSIVNTSSLSSVFFKNGKPSINLSAIVGKNGSGKSSLIDLLIACINNLSHYFKINTQINLDILFDIKAELYFQADSYYKVVLNKTMRFYRQNKTEESFIEIRSTDFKSKDFFYSIIINYSHYGLNAKEVGPWINKLFHKNDGYQVPIVLSPMRTDGNIDINNERALAESRLMANILRPAVINSDDQLLITNNSVAEKIKIQLIQDINSVIYENVIVQKSSRKEKDRGSYSERTSVEKVTILDLKDNFKELLKVVNSVFNFDYIDQMEGRDYVSTIAHQYIIKKLVKIAVTYPFYNHYFDKDKKKFAEGKFKEFVMLLFDKNENHISFKLKQTLNFLKHKHIKFNNSNVSYLNIKAFAKKIASIISKNKLESEAIMELLPPPIFSHNIILRIIPEKPGLVQKKSKLIDFFKLSSGEKQLIFSVNTVLYHLINLDSIKNHRYQKGYQFVNITLDEIELYFHPERQKQFISFLLNRIGELQYKNIKAINLCFITHSPFILSDIPNTNILFLDEFGNPQKNAMES
jgi:predicted ATPase